MTKKINWRKPLGLSLILMAIAFFGYYLVYGNVLQEGKNIGEKYKKVQCDLNIKDGIFGKPYIDTYTCYSTGDCSPLLPFNLFYNQGNILMQMGEKVTSKDYSTFKLGGSYELSLSQCTTFRSGTLKLTDEKNNVIETKTFDIK